MTVEHVFVDTNILVYAHDSDAGLKHTKAQALVRSLWSNTYPPAISTQVLCELYVSLQKKGAPPKASKDIVDSYFVWEVIESDLALVRDSIDIKMRHQLSFWDSLILCAAKRANASILYTEDLQDGAKLLGLTVQNPFS